MKKTLLGFKQEKLVEEGLDLKDIHILRYVIDFIDTGIPHKKTIKGKEYYWIKNIYILKSLPVLEINLTRSLRKRIKVLVEKGFLECEVSFDGGSYTFYRKGARLDILLCDKKDSYKNFF